MLAREIRYKSIYDEHRDKKNLQKFIDGFTKIIEARFGEGFRCYSSGSKDDGSFNISFNTYTNDNNCTIQLNMSFNYPEKHHLITNDDEAYNDRDLEIILNNRLQLMYVYIKGLYITPQGNGLGTYIITNMITWLKEFSSIKFIILTPKQSAYNFWKKVGFVDISIKEHYSLIKLTHDSHSNDLIFIL